MSGIADWIQLRAGYLCTALKLKNNKLPHHSTDRRILSEVINADEFEQTIAEYLLQLPRSGQDMVIAIDGKTVRGTITAGDPFGLHLLAAYLPGEGFVLMQMVVDKEKENEIVVASNLLNCLDLRNKVVTGDAMHTQRQLSAQIVSMGGNFVWIVKDNQPKTLKAIELLFTPAQPITESGRVAVERGFHRLKGVPLSLNPLFVKNDDQVSGLTNLLSIAVRILTLIEFTVQRRLTQNQEQLTSLIENNPKKGIDNPTTERLLNTFNRITRRSFICQTALFAMLHHYQTCKPVSWNYSVCHQLSIPNWLEIRESHFNFSEWTA